MVVLTLKNLQQKAFNVEIDLSASVKELKEKIEKENGDEYPAKGQKLIYAGKILQDDNILETYNIDEKKFLVIMVTKPKSPPPSSAPIDPTVAAAEELAATSQKEEESSPPKESTPPTTTSETSSSITSTTTTTTTAASTPTTETETKPDTAESLIVVGDDYNKMVENIMEMGYERAQVERALRASFNNPYTAVQYLVDGIPSNVDFAAPVANPTPARAGTDEAPEGGDDEEDPLEFLRSQPQFNQMRQMIRSNPQLLDAFVQQIGQTNPELLRVIQQNQEAFVRMINEGPPSSGTTGGTGTTTEGTTGSTGTTAPSSGQRASSDQNAILVSPQDRDAIQRLKTLGNFPEDVVIQAYFACEKNENLAAEFLFSQSWD